MPVTNSSSHLKHDYRWWIFIPSWHLNELLHIFGVSVVIETNGGTHHLGDILRERRALDVRNPKKINPKGMVCLVEISLESIILIVESRLNHPVL